MPAADAAPESGELAGNVRLRLFSPAADGSRPDPDASVPLGTATFDQPLQFDFKYARLSSSGPFTITTDQVEFKGSFLTAVVNQVRQRLEVLEVRQGGSIRALPAAPRPARPLAPDSAAPDPPVAGASVAAATTEDRTPAPASAVDSASASAKVDLYRAVFADAVTVTRGEQRLTGDQLDVFLRLVNNALPERAIATLDTRPASPGLPSSPPPQGTQTPATSTPAPALGTTEVGLLTPALSAPTGPTPGATLQDDLPVVLEWDGPMRIQPLTDEPPSELAENDLYLRVTAERTGSVVMADAGARATARAASLDYALTTADLTLSGPGGGVRLSAQGSGTLDASRLVANLRNGVVLVRGPGLLMVDESLRPAPDVTASGPTRPTQISWTDQAEFFFDARTGRMSGALDRAELDGDVQAADGLAVLRGQRLAAAFVADDTGGRRLTTLDVDSGRADDGQGGFIEGTQIHVDFLPGTLGREIDPSRLFASGNVRAGRDGSVLVAQTLDARLERDFEGQVGVSEVVADGSVEYLGPDAVRVAADRMIADAVAQLVTLRSESGTARVGRAGATVSGSQILINGRARTARVVGPGRFDLAPDPGTPSNAPNDASHASARTVEATWVDGMSFDDVAGRIECFGQAAAVSRSRPGAPAASGPTQKDTLAAERVLIELSPAPPGTTTATARADRPQTRALLRATAYGTVNAQGAAQPASVESRLYLADDPDRVERLFYLEGMEIAADNARSTLTVPGAGKLLMLDRRDRAASTTNSGSLWGELASAGPGLTRFEWREGMSLDRASGRATMTSRVRLRHKSLADGSTIDLQSDRLSADIQETLAPPGATTQPAPGTDAVRGELVRADATGSVYFAAKGRELVADQIRYDATRGEAIATTLGTNPVSYFDPSRGSPVTAPRLTWDMRQDRITLDRPGAFTTAGP
jgi:lipopolysaccharide export system protein LptA